LKPKKNQIAILLLLMCIPVVCFAQLEISGPQSGTLGPGDYIVVGDIVVESGTSLTIISGTTFNHDGSYNWEIYGSFNAVGAENDSIYFIREGFYRWGSLRFMSNAPVAVMDYCVVEDCYQEYSENYISAVNVTGGMGLILTHSRVSDCKSMNYASGVYVANSVAYIDSCKILNNGVVNHLKGPGIYLKNCADSYILNSIIAHNYSDGGA
jgi:hypothetical protein